MTQFTRSSTPARTLRRGRRWAFALVLLVILAAGQEVVFRGLFGVPEVEGFNRIHYQISDITDPQSGTSDRRGLGYNRYRFSSDLDGFSEVHSLNVYGFRTRDFAIDPPAGRRRILLLGDSVTEGQGASDSETIASAWERQLGREAIRAEVLNLGVIAATLPMLTELARDAIPLLRPTDVVCIVYANDLPAPGFTRELAMRGSQFPRHPTSWWTPRAADLVARAFRGEPIRRRWPHAAIASFPAVPSPVNPWTQRTDRPAGLDPAVLESMKAGRVNPWLYEQVEALPGMLSHDFATGGIPTLYCMRWGELCRAVGANLMVVYVPFYAVTSPRYAPALERLGMDPGVARRLSQDSAYRRQNAVLETVCRTLQLPFCDTTETLSRADAAGTPQFWSYDSHPRPAGYATIAGAIHETWKRAFGRR